MEKVKSRKQSRDDRDLAFSTTAWYISSELVISLTELFSWVEITCLPFHILCYRKEVLVARWTFFLVRHHLSKLRRTDRPFWWALIFKHQVISNIWTSNVKFHSTSQLMSETSFLETPSAHVDTTTSQSDDLVSKERGLISGWKVSSLNELWSSWILLH
jgi:hypothetical protein